MMQGKATLAILFSVLATGCVSYHDVDDGKTFMQRAGESRWNRSLPTSAVGSQLTGTFAASPRELLDAAAWVAHRRGDRIVFRSDRSGMMAVRAQASSDDGRIEWYNVLAVGDPLRSTLLIAPHGESRRTYRFARPVNFHAIVADKVESIDTQRAVMEAVAARVDEQRKGETYD